MAGAAASALASSSVAAIFTPSWGLCTPWRKVRNIKRCFQFKDTEPSRQTLQTNAKNQKQEHFAIQVHHLKTKRLKYIKTTRT